MCLNEVLLNLYTKNQTLSMIRFNLEKFETDATQSNNNQFFCERCQISQSKNSNHVAYSQKIFLSADFIASNHSAGPNEVRCV